MSRQQSLLHGRDTVGTLVSIKAGQACHPVLLGATTAAGPSSCLSWLHRVSPSPGLDLRATVAFRSLMTQGCHSPLLT